MKSDAKTEGKGSYASFSFTHSPVEVLWKITKHPAAFSKGEIGTNAHTSAMSSGGSSLFSAGKA